MTTGRRILLVTGRDEGGAVRNAAPGCEVVVAPIDVAAFISPEMVARLLEGRSLSSADLVIVPGLMGGDVGVVTKKLGVRCFKGTKNSYDLGDLLKNIGKLTLSTTKPADIYLEDSAMGEYERMAKGARGADFRIGDLGIGGGQPPRILAEVVDAPLLDVSEVLKKAKYYLDSGADIIDIGAVANSDNHDTLGKIVSTLVEYVKAPVSIDSVRKSEIEAAVSGGAELVLSVDQDNYDLDMPSKTAVVVIPDRGEKSRDGIVKSLLRNIELAEGAGFKKIIADPILQPPLKGLSDSLSVYGLFREKSGVPAMMGVGNVTEMIDADSVGINAILCSIAMELGISLLLTTENSVKTRNCVSELKDAVVLNYLAMSRKALPKDMGTSLLVSKSKNDAPPVELPSCTPCTRGFDDGMDPRGIFRIMVNHGAGLVYVTHYSGGKELCFSGCTARGILDQLLSEGLIGTMSHSAYMGRELQKAETCLRLGKAYAQDDLVFPPKRGL